MRNVVGVEPGVLSPEDLDGISHALDRTTQQVGETARLVGPDGQSTELPPSIHSLLVSVVEMLKSGVGVSIIPTRAELSTAEAADILNVSRPFLIRQIEAGSIPDHMAGTHRRLRLLDVLAYRDRVEARTQQALDAMIAEAEDLGLYDLPGS